MTLYKLIGTDGQQYGPAPAEQIRQWIRENRVERQSPVFVPGATDWTFIGLLPEFADAFPATTAVNPPPLPSSAPAPAPAIIAPVTMPRSYSMATAGLICGILAVTVGCCCAGLPFNVLGLIFSVVALVRCADNPQYYGGRGRAILGLILSAIGFLIFSIVLVLR